MLREINLQYKNCTRLSPADFEFPINLIGLNIAKKDTTCRAAVPAEERLAVTLRLFS
jgi:hypothetical protein